MMSSMCLIMMLTFKCLTDKYCCQHRKDECL